MELKYKCWRDITINVFQRLMEIDNNILTGDIDIDNINKNISLLSIICDVDEDTIADLDINEFGRLVRQTTFLENMPKAEIKDKYKINGKDYYVHLNLQEMTMAQYIDFQTFIKDKDKYTKEIIACFLIPKGKKYGDDYRIADVVNEIGEYMSIVDAHSIFFFFTLSFQSLTKVTLNYLSKKMKKMMKKEKNEEMKNKMKEAIEQIQIVQALVQDGVGLDMLK